MPLIAKQTLFDPGLPNVGWWVEDQARNTVLARTSLGPNADRPPGVYCFLLNIPLGFQGRIFSDNGLVGASAQYSCEDIDLTLFATRADVQALQSVIQAAGLAGAGNAQVSSATPAQTASGYSLALKRGDTLPSVALHLLDGSGHPVALPAGTAVRFHMGQSGRVAAVDAPAQIVDSATALVQYAWRAGDTARAAIYAAEFQVTFPDGSVETWPNQSSLTIQIVADVA